MAVDLQKEKEEGGGNEGGGWKERQKSEVEQSSESWAEEEEQIERRGPPHKIRYFLTLQPCHSLKFVENVEVYLDDNYMSLGAAWLS